MTTKENITLENYNLLKNLQSHQKLIVRGDKFEIDSRWIQGIQRRCTGDSRSDLILPIETTFNMMRIPTKDNYQDIIKVLGHLEHVFLQTYPDDNSGLVKCVKDLREKYIKASSKRSGQILNNLLTAKEFKLYCSGKSN